MGNIEKIIISPKTKVLQLIETWPQLEDVLNEYVPTFSNFKNPTLQKTVAKITTLQQAATIGNVKVEDLVNRMRKEVGQELIGENADNSYKTEKPGWMNEKTVHKELDAREMLAAGEHPVNQVMADLKQLPAGSLYKLKAPFLPAPLIDKASSLSVEHWVNEISGTEYEIYFYKSQ